MRPDTAEWQITLDATEAEAIPILEHDRIWNSFALADLDPPFHEYTQIAIAAKDAQQPAACLNVRHPAFAVLSPFGAPDGVAALLAALAAAHHLPASTLIQSRAEHLPTLDRYYELPPGGRELLRMAVAADAFKPFSSPPSASSPQVERLRVDDLPALTALYALYPENHFHPGLLEHEVFYGLRDGETLLAAGGTHVVAPRYGLAVLGGIFTRPDARGQGYAQAITSTLVAALFARGCRDVVLNVLAENAPAIHVYARLGFQTHCRYWTGEAALRENTSNRPN